MNENLRYAESHEWILVEGDTGTVGITDHAQAELTDIVFAEPPPVGRKLAAGEVAAVVESVKAASDIYAPVSGRVTNVNEALNDAPEIVNESAEDSAWMAMMAVDDPSELAALMNRQQYDEYLRGLE